LKAVRSNLTKEQWNAWLQYARNEKSRRLTIASIEAQDSQRNYHYHSDNNPSIPLKHSTPDNNKKITTNLSEDESLAYMIQNQKRDTTDDSKLHINDMKNSPSIVKDDINVITNEYSNTDNTHSPRAPNNNIGYNENPKNSMSPFSLNQKSQINNRYTHVNNNKLEEITDIATASALRIDSVQSAAKCLIASIEADMKEKVLSSPGNMEDKSTTLSILQSMVTSLEKSSSSLEQIVKLKNNNTRPGGYDQDDIFNESFQEINENVDDSTRTRRSYSVGMEHSRGPRNYQVFEREPRSRGRSPSPAPLRRTNSRDNLSYTSTSVGYNWQGGKYRKAQERVVKICIAEGPLVKAFEDFPVRLDLESLTADVVWREERPTYNNNDENRSTIMRRERFNFDDIFCGPNAMSRMKTYVQQRTRKAILEGTNITFIGFACGLSNNPMEPPLAILLGASGGSGVASMVINELFNTNSQSLNIPSSSLSISMSATLFSDGQIVDLLNSSSGNTRNADTQCKVQKYKNGQYYLADATQVNLTSSNDYDRIVGVILGRRSLWREFAPWFGPSFNKFPEAPWVYSQGEETNFLLTFNVSYTSGISKQRNQAKFSFVCPCGENWGVPGQELNQLVEAISYLPYAAPPSLMKSSQLNTLLVDSTSPASSYINIVGVQRNESSQGPLDRIDSRTDNNVVHTSLATLRCLSSLNSNQ